MREIYLEGRNRGCRKKIPINPFDYNRYGFQFSRGRIPRKNERFATTPAPFSNNRYSIIGFDSLNWPKDIAIV